MSYLVLARKWRPRRFAELVGQTHVVRALTNALNSGRVHHAFLFAGTRGVGKTTIARIFAKSLNCERGGGAEPCGECPACIDIDAGRFVDLLEIDAASNTGVDDVRELIDNAQYMPSRGRVKVYLIDEVHMLSKAAFNALLKTLEEPPEHVKFLLATTDPQKLPVTVLSRCLQFNLKRLDAAQIAGQLRHILSAEGISYDEPALALLARAADGSLRDGLSLLDQAIAYTGGQIDQAGVAAMLGTVDRNQVAALLAALAAGDGAALLQTIETSAEFAPDWSAVLEALTEALHQIQLAQLVPGFAADAGAVPVPALATALAPELVQLWYQMALDGRRDLALAPSPRIGFEMTLLRMLAFRPDNVGASASPPGPMPQRASARSGAAPDAQASAVRGVTPPAAPTGTVAPVAPVAPDASPATLASSEDWFALIARVGVRGPARELAAHAVFSAWAAPVLDLWLADGWEHLRSETVTTALARALEPALGQRPRIRFVQEPPSAGETLNERETRARDQRRTEAETAFLNDPAVRHLVKAYGARVLPHSIRPLDE